MTRIELGCGCTKTEGYIGVDRFDLQGVDIIADLDTSFPFENDSVDEIWASHSLEHLENIEHVFKEIYRVCKHGAIVQILAPYYFTTLNISNFYHKSVWTEDTPRLFDIYPTEMIKAEEYSMPHGTSWGVGCSDNSNMNTVFQVVKEEFFYFPEYCHLSSELKRQARRSMINVCDQVFYVLVVNKSGIPFSKNELISYAEKAKGIEPPRIGEIRKRDEISAQKKLQSIFDRVNKIECDYLKTEKCLDELHEDVKGLIGQEKILFDSVNKRIDAFQDSNDKLKNDIVQKMYFLSSYKDVPKDIIKKWNNTFYDGLLLNDYYRKVEKCYFSENIQLEKYFEYGVPAGFSRLSICMFTLTPTSIFLELVNDGKIVKQMVENVNGMQLIEILNDTISETSYLRIRLLEDGFNAIAKVLLIKDGKKEKLAYSVKY